MTMTTTQRQRHQMIANVLQTARAHGLPVMLASWLDTKVRVHNAETDHPMWVRVRDLRADHVRCD